MYSVTALTKRTGTTQFTSQRNLLKKGISESRLNTTSGANGGRVDTGLDMGFPSVDQIGYLQHKASDLAKTASHKDCASNQQGAAAM